MGTAESAGGQRRTLLGCCTSHIVVKLPQVGYLKMKVRNLIYLVRARIDSSFRGCQPSLGDTKQGLSSTCNNSTIHTCNNHEMCSQINWSEMMLFRVRYSTVHHSIVTLYCNHYWISYHSKGAQCLK